MTQDTGGYSPPPTTTIGSTGSSSTVEVARDEARGVGESAREAGGHVARTAADQARDVVAETGQQARNLMHEGRQQVREQAITGQHKAAEGLAAIADELRQMADRGGQNGVASELARQAADRVHDVAAWLQKREPGDLLDEVRNWARQRPGAFLLGAALAGVIAGRLTRGAVAAQRESEDLGPAPDSFGTQPIATPPVEPVLPSDYPAPTPASGTFGPPPDEPYVPHQEQGRSGAGHGPEGR